MPVQNIGLYGKSRVERHVRNVTSQKRYVVPFSKQNLINNGTCEKLVNIVTEIFCSKLFY